MSKNLILYPSWEDRSYLGFFKDINDISFDKVFIIKNLNTLYSVKTNDSINKIEEECNKNGIEYQFIEISKNGVETWNCLKDTVALLNCDDIFLDITTMSRNILWILLFFIKEKYIKATLFYHQPLEYSGDWISKEPDKPRLLFKHSGLITLGMPTCLFILTGFDPERTKQLLAYYEPQKVILGIQTGSQFNNTKRNSKEKHIDICYNMGFSDIETFDINSFSEDCGFSQNDKIIIDNIEKYNLIATSLGPKLSAFSLYQCFLKHPEIALCYIPCKEYNINYCTGIGEKFIKEISFL